MNFFFLQVIIDSSKIKDSLVRAGILPAPGKQNLWDILKGWSLRSLAYCLLPQFLFF
jgi:hypothetical protein